jgi:hypothetical protein
LSSFFASSFFEVLSWASAKLAQARQTAIHTNTLRNFIKPFSAKGAKPKFSLAASCRPRTVADRGTVSKLIVGRRVAKHLGTHFRCPAAMSDGTIGPWMRSKQRRNQSPIGAGAK